MRTSRYDRWDVLSSASPDLLFGVRQAEYVGTEGNDLLTGSNSDDVFDLSQGGDDAAYGGWGADRFYFGSTFTGADHVDGGDQVDTVLLDGDYSAGITLQDETLINLEQLTLTGGSYVVTGELLLPAFGSVDATALNSSQTLHMDVSGNSSNLVLIYSGDGDDILDFAQYQTGASIYGNGGNDNMTGGGAYSYLHGGDGDDVIRVVGAATNTFFSVSGDDGDDVLINRSGGLVEFHGGGGADSIMCHHQDAIFEYGLASDSTPASFDTIVHFTEGRFVFSFDSNTLRSGEQHRFRLSDTSGHPGDIVIHYDRSIHQTIVDVFTDKDDIPDFVVHLTGQVELTTEDFTTR